MDERALEHLGIFDVDTVVIGAGVFVVKVEPLHGKIEVVPRVAVRSINDLQLVEKETAVLGQELGRHPSFEEVAERVELGRSGAVGASH